jgi:hypothetical protein
MEKAHFKLCKYSIKVGKKATNSGQYRLSTYIKILKYGINACIPTFFALFM